MSDEDPTTAAHEVKQFLRKSGNKEIERKFNRFLEFASQKGMNEISGLISSHFFNDKYERMSPEDQERHETICYGAFVGYCLSQGYTDDEITNYGDSVQDEIRRNSNDVEYIIH